MKECKNCGILKDYSEFWPSNKSADGLEYRCKDCDAERTYSSTLKRRYGITIKQRNELIVEQDNRCAICARVFGDDTKSVHIDHCHRTKKVRGILCFNCNRLLGWYENNKQAIDEYLK